MNSTSHENLKFQRLYVHVPFCAAKCAYCAFYSEPHASAVDIEAYFKRLEREFKEHALATSPLESIYIGGGTPTWLSARNLRRLFELIRANFAVADGAEISIECNPETLTPAKAREIAKFADRVSVGIQSFNPKFRRIIGRQGRAESIVPAFEMLAAEGIANLGADLIYAIPGQSLADWRNELERACMLPVKHVSAYSLTFEEGTALATRHGLNHEHDLSAEMWKLAGRFLSTRGFRRYEISNYARKGSECAHNLGTWFGDTYLGCGPAASSFDGTRRWTNPASLAKWCRGEAPEIDEIPPERRAREIFTMGLRTSQGWNRECFKAATGFDFMEWQSDMAQIAAAGLLNLSEEKVRCTARGLLLWNQVAERVI